ncbi:MAG: hypothetical protein FRX49_08152 [Trebouxia sp. A1-2]|nr:MAG: hypothetical protein FRX49_08152 [Trebouxia sp. A1-2]
MEAAQAPSSAKKRKLPSFMAVKPVKCAAHASQFLLFNPAQYHMFQLFRLGKSEKPDETDSDPNGASPARPKIPKKEPRQSKLPLKKPLPPTVAKMHRPEQAAASSSKQHAVLSISDIALVKECQDILDKSAATSAATGSISQPLIETESSKSSKQSADHRREVTCREADAPMQPAAAAVDMMDMETQLLAAEPHPMSKAMHSVAAAGRAGDQAENDSQETQSSNPPLQRLVSNGNSQNVMSTEFSRPKTDSATWQPQQSTTAAAMDLELPGNLPAAVQASQFDTAAISPASAPAPASHKKASNLDSLLEAMLAGDL